MSGKTERSFRSVFGAIIWPLARLAFFTALVRGAFLWLEQSHQIHVDRWIAAMIGAAESAAAQAQGCSLGLPGLPLQPPGTNQLYQRPVARNAPHLAEVRRAPCRRHDH